MKILKKILPFLLFVLLLSVKVYGSDSENVSFPKLSVMENFGTIEEANKGGYLFLFSAGKINVDVDSLLVVINGDLVINGDINANVFCLFSNVKISGAISEKIRIRSFSSNLELPSAFYDRFYDLIPFAGLYNKVADDLKTVEYIGEVPKVVLQAMFITVEIFACMSLYSMKKSFFEQGAALVYKEPMNVFGNGTISMFFFFTLALVFVMTIVLIPASALFILVGYTLGLIGQVSLGIITGYCVLKKGFKLKKTDNGWFLFAGLVIFGFLKIIPYFGFLFFMFILPLFSMGTFFTNAINALIKRRFYDLPFASSNDKSNAVIRTDYRELLIK